MGEKRDKSGEEKVNTQEKLVLPLVLPFKMLIYALQYPVGWISIVFFFAILVATYFFGPWPYTIAICVGAYILAVYVLYKEYKFVDIALPFLSGTFFGTLMKSVDFPLPEYMLGLKVFEYIACVFLGVFVALLLKWVITRRAVDVATGIRVVSALVAASMAFALAYAMIMTRGSAMLAIVFVIGAGYGVFYKKSEE